MSLTAVKTYFENRCLAVNLKRHSDAFNDENVPASYIDQAFHVRINSATGVSLNQQPQAVNTSVTVVFWIKGLRNPSTGLDTAVQKSETLMKEVLKNVNRLGQSIKTVVFDNLSYEALSEDNDNAIKVTMNFTALVYIEIT